MVFPHIIVATGAEDVPYGTVTISKAADSMLAMSKIEATFVIALNEQGSISISARSKRLMCKDYGANGGRRRPL